MKGALGYGVEGAGKWVEDVKANLRCKGGGDDKRMNPAQFRRLMSNTIRCYVGAGELCKEIMCSSQHP